MNSELEKRLRDGVRTGQISWLVLHLLARLRNRVQARSFIRVHR